MCGICGAVGYRAEERIKEEILFRMMNAIRHRGPDGSGKYISDDVMLGFQRLSIIDNKTGMQPMWNEDKTIALIFNGEIYNFKLLRVELEKRGHIFYSKSDSEVLLHGYEEYQMGLLKRLQGMFSFVIWDDRRKKMFAARDNFGIKPFYYAWIGGTLVFASEIKSILEFPGYNMVLNEEALEHYLSFQYSVLPETFFKGIYQLRPGHYLEYENWKLRTVNYYEPMLEPMDARDWTNMQDDIHKVVFSSVKEHMASDVEVGTFLSGGVDSSLISAVSGCHKTFTVGFSDAGRRYDETLYTKELAECIGVENHCRYIGKNEFLEAVPDVVYHLDEPLGDASAIALYFLAKEASKQVKVVLSGEGADEIFGGYNIYLEPKALKLMKWLPLGLRKILAVIAEKVLPEHMKGRNYLVRAAQELDERYIGNAYIFHESEKKKLLLRKRNAICSRELLSEDYIKFSHLGDSDKMQSIDLKYWLPGDILQKADKMSMAHSIELRVPFLDKNVFSVARKIPHRIKTKHYTTKYILRKVAAIYLPKKAANRKKLGFPVPIRNWIMEEDWYQNIKKLFGGEASSHFFQREYLLGLLEEHREGKADNSRKIWTVYTFLVWYQVFFCKNGKEITEVSGWKTVKKKESDCL